jgi:hypothetical protein
MVTWTRRAVFSGGLDSLHFCSYDWSTHCFQELRLTGGKVVKLARMVHLGPMFRAKPHLTLTLEICKCEAFLAIFLLASGGALSC